jgi:hypothetical protein
MKTKKNYITPQIDQVNIDVSISICLTTEDTPPDPGDVKPLGGSGNAAAQQSVNTFEESKLNENPFK